MAFWYIINSQDHTVIFGGDNVEPHLPTGVDHLSLRRSDHRLSPEEINTEIARARFVSKENTQVGNGGDDDFDASMMKLALLGALWAEYRVLGKGQSIRAFATNVLKCAHGVASRVIHLDSAFNPDEVHTLYEAAREWQTANPSVTTALR